MVSKKSEKPAPGATTAKAAETAEVHVFITRRRLEVLAVLPIGTELVVELTLLLVLEDFVGFVESP